MYCNLADAWKNVLRMGIKMKKKATKPAATNSKELEGLLLYKKIAKAYMEHNVLSKEDEARQRSTSFPKNIKFSILVPLYNTPLSYLHDMIDSVLAQTYGNWELCLADGSDEKHPKVGKHCLEYANKDKRIIYKKLTENKGIAGNTNECIAMATGGYLSLFDHDDMLHPSALYETMQAICTQDADFVYTDEVAFENDDITDVINLHFKPDFAPDNLLANNYICHFTSFSAKLLERSGVFRQYDGSQDHDMILRLTSVAEKVCHVPKVLYYWRSHPASVASDISAKPYAVEAGKRVVRDYLAAQGVRAEVESTKVFPAIYKIKYEMTEKPMISILIPNKDHIRDLTKCIDSIREKSTYENYEIIVIENNSEQEITFRYYEYLESLPNVRVVYYQKGFNYSAINNFGEGFARGEYLLLLNNDTEVITPEWLEEMLSYAQRKDVGAVGAKLYYADDTIQHAGIVLGLGAHRAAGHVSYRVPRDSKGYMGRLHYVQNVTAVTGACLMVKKSLYDELGGLDEGFAVALNDVDFCLRVREKGYLNIFMPDAELYHYESKSRGFEDTEEKSKRFESEVQLFKERWDALIKKGDPYYNVNFSLDYADYAIKDIERA